MRTFTEEEFVETICGAVKVYTEDQIRAAFEVATQGGKYCILENLLLALKGEDHGE